VDGTYGVEISLESVGGSVKNTYSFNLEVNSAGFIISTENFDNKPPDLLIENIDKQGNVRIMFTKFMEIPDQISDVDKKVFDIEIRAADPDRQSLLTFEWEIQDFTQEYCVLKLEFENPLEVSSELGLRDKLHLKVIDDDPLKEAFNGHLQMRVPVGTRRRFDIPP